MRASQFAGKQWNKTCMNAGDGGAQAPKMIHIEVMEPDL
jgi:hypothetical protein